MERLFRERRSIENVGEIINKKESNMLEIDRCYRIGTQEYRDLSDTLIEKTLNSENIVILGNKNFFLNLKSLISVKNFLRIYTKAVNTPLSYDDIKIFLLCYDGICECSVNQNKIVEYSDKIREVFLRKRMSINSSSDVNPDIELNTIQKVNVYTFNYERKRDKIKEIVVNSEKEKIIFNIISTYKEYSEANINDAFCDLNSIQKDLIENSLILNSIRMFEIQKDIDHFASLNNKIKDIDINLVVKGIVHGTINFYN